MTDLKGDLSTTVSKNDIKDAISDSCGVLYSKDGKRLLKCENKNLRQYDIKEGTEVICDDAFDECKNLKKIKISDGVIKIGDGAFFMCENLVKITIPFTVTEIVGSAFCGCLGMTEYKVAESNECFCSKDGVLFSKPMETLIRYPVKSTCTSYVIPDGVIEIGNMAFYDCDKLTNVKIPDSVKGIGHFAFGYCSGLREIIIPDSVTEIGWNAFSYCKYLHSIIIPCGVTKIGFGTFSGCKYLEEVTIPASVAEIGALAFDDCRNMEKFVSLNPIPPICNPEAFNNVPLTINCYPCVLYVPEGSMDAYCEADGWGNFEINELE